MTPQSGRALGRKAATAKRLMHQNRTALGPDPGKAGPDAEHVPLDEAPDAKRPRRGRARAPLAPGATASLRNTFSWIVNTFASPRKQPVATTYFSSDHRQRLPDSPAHGGRAYPSPQRAGALGTAAQLAALVSAACRNKSATGMLVQHQSTTDNVCILNPYVVSPVFGSLMEGADHAAVLPGLGLGNKVPPRRLHRARRRRAARQRRHLFPVDSRDGLPGVVPPCQPERRKTLHTSRRTR